MQKELFLIFLVVSLIVAAMMTDVAAATAPADRQFFERVIDAAGSQCYTAEDENTSSDLARRISASCRRKSDYFKEHKTALVDHLIQQKAPQNAYMVDYYLNNYYYAAQQKAVERLKNNRSE